MSHTEKNVKDIAKMLKKGYIEMSEINLEEANMCLESDNSALELFEKELTECE